MPRSLLITILPFMSYICQAQEVLGKYSASFLGAETIEFVGRDSFYFNGFYCTHGMMGKGTCEIGDGYLYLYFEKANRKKQKGTQKSPAIAIINDADSVNIIDITCIGTNDHPISYASVVIESRKQPIQSGLVDTLGKIKFAVRQNDFPITIKSSAVGFDTGELQLDQAGQYVIRIFHSEFQLPETTLNKGEVFVYEIKELEPDLIVMRRLNGQFHEYRKNRE